MPDPESSTGSVSLRPAARPAYRKRDVVELDVVDVGDGDKWFGRLASGISVFVIGPAAVGDRVSAALCRIKSKFLEARLVDVLAPSPARIEPRCSHFGRCGGCKWQHLQYAEQLRLKRKHVADAVQRIGGLEGVPVAEPVEAAEKVHYRNKIEFTFARARQPDGDGPRVRSRPVADAETPALGFYLAGDFRTILNVDYCHIATPEMNVVRDALRRFAVERDLGIYSQFDEAGWLRQVVIRQARHTDDLMVNLVTVGPDPEAIDALAEVLKNLAGASVTTFVHTVMENGRQQSSFGRERVVFGPGTMMETLCGYRFRVSPQSFFQTNTGQAERLYRRIGDLAELQPDDILYDLYCGTGTIGITLAASCQRVLGFESVAAAVADARRNADLNETPNCEFIEADLDERWAEHPSMAGRPGPTVVVADPPRAGMHPNTVASLRRLRPRRLVYVSCKPASMARDLAALCADGGYRATHVEPVDLFPYTPHIEAIAVADAV